MWGGSRQERHVQSWTTRVRVSLRKMRPDISCGLNIRKEATYLGGLGHEINLLITDCAPELDSLQSNLFIWTLHTSHR